MARVQLILSHPRKHEGLRLRPILSVAESLFQSLKRERIKRRFYADREEVRTDVFDYIEMFYNPKRRHGYNKRPSPIEFERQHFERLDRV
jgi:putative transposase